MINTITSTEEWTFMDKPVIIIGCGGHAHVLYDCLKLLGANVLGALDKRPSFGKKKGGVICPS